MVACRGRTIEDMTGSKGKKNGTFCPFGYLNDDFTKTGSGQT
jgi:hypothetical protein